MDVQIKDLVVAVRESVPSWAADMVVTFSLVTDNNEETHITIMGIPPNDETKIQYHNNSGEIIRNWGAVEVESLIDTPSNIEARRKNLKDYDNKRGPTSKES